MWHVAEGTPAVPAVLLRMLAVHFAAFVDLDLVLDQLGIIVQLLQLDVPEELLEAAYSRLLVRRHRNDCAWRDPLSVCNQLRNAESFESFTRNFSK